MQSISRHFTNGHCLKDKNCYRSYRNFSIIFSKEKLGNINYSTFKKITSDKLT